MLRWVNRKFSGDMKLTNPQQQWLEYFQQVFSNLSKFPKSFIS